MSFSGVGCFLFFGFSGLFFCPRSIVSKGVEFSKRMFLLVHVSVLSGSEHCELNYSCQDCERMKFIFVTYWHGIAFPVQSCVIGWMETHGHKS